MEEPVKSSDLLDDRFLSFKNVEIGGTGFGMPDTFTDAIFNAARAYVDNYSFDEWFWKSLFDRKLKKKGR